MDAGATGIDDLSWSEVQSSIGSFESDIEASQSSLDKPFANRPSTRNSRTFHPCINLLGNSRLFFANPNENVGISASSITASSGSDSDRQKMLSQIVSRLVRHPWTESTEFTELWSDIPGECASNQTHSVDQEQTAAEQDGTSISDVKADSNKAESRTSFGLLNHSWNESTELPNQCSRKPSNFSTNQNSQDDRQLMNQSVSYINRTAVSTEESDNEKYLRTALRIPRRLWTESTEFTELWSDIPNEQNRNRNLFKSKEKSKIAFCRASSGIKKIILLIVTSVASVSAIYMGGVHVGFCPANEGATNLVYMIGLFGLFFSFCRLSSHFMHDVKLQLRKAAEIMRFITVFLILIEMGIFFSMSPSFEVPENYCDKSFYKYTFYMNFAAAGIVFLSVLHYYKACKTQSG